MPSGNLLKKLDAGAKRAAETPIEEESEKTPVSPIKGRKGSVVSASEEGKTPTALKKQLSTVSKGGKDETPKSKASVARRGSVKEDPKLGASKGKKDGLEPESPEKTPKAADAKKKEEPAKKVTKAFSKDKQAFHREYFVNSSNLTATQKVYETKHGSKHYKPS